MTAIEQLLRPDLRGRSAYGAPQRDVPVALNVNENTHPVPDGVVAEVIERVRLALRTVNRYPDREFLALREALAGYLGHGLDAARIWAANGSNEVIQHVLQAFGGPGRRVLGFPPTYSMHPIIAASTGTAWATGRRDADFALSPATVIEAVERTSPDLVFLCAPNNPTGTPVGLDAIAAAYDATDGIVFVDEAYGEFMPPGAPSALTLLPGRDRLVVSRTMSKAFAFAGARVGYLAADPAVTDALRLVRLPYHLSSLTQAAALGALDHAAEMLRTVAAVAAERDRTARGLADLGYHPYPSHANFVFFEGVDDPAAVWQALLDRGVLIRDVGIPHSLRVSAGTSAETDAFLAAMRGVRDGQAPAALGGCRMSRTAAGARATAESTVDLSVDLDGTGQADVDTSVPFLDHLLTAFAKHSLTDLAVRAAGDTRIDVHHTAEDVGIVLGGAIRDALGDKRGIARFGDATVPLDDALTLAVVDLSGRPYLVHSGEPAGFEFHLIGGHFTGSMVRHVLEAIVLNARLTAHVRVLAGRDPHHIAESEFKAFARAFRFAKAPDSHVDGVPSTKGSL